MMATREYKVVSLQKDDLERELNALSRDGWQPVLITPDGFGGSSFSNFGPSRVDSFCVVLARE